MRKKCRYKLHRFFYRFDWRIWDKTLVQIVRISLSVDLTEAYQRIDNASIVFNQIPSFVKK